MNVCDFVLYKKLFMGGIQDYKEHNHHIGFTCGGHNFLHLAHEIQLFIIMELLCMT